MKWFEDDSKPIISEKVKAMSLEQLLDEIEKKEKKLQQKKLRSDRPTPANA
jgi:hypothetical protein